MDGIDYAKKLAKILRADYDEVFMPACRVLEQATGHKNILAMLEEEAEQKINEKLEMLGVSSAADATEVYDALISKIEADDTAIFDLLRRPDYLQPHSYKTILGFAREFSRVGEGFFLKHKKAEEFLRKFPPKNILAALDYKNADQLLANEDLLEIYSALRFIEGNDWLNNYFFRQYEDLLPSDFEWRHVELRVLSPRWEKAAETFLAKKHHNVSHLKELGVIFVIPWSLGVSGETLRLLSMLLHYMHEIDFYSALFQKFSHTPMTFAEKFISALRGDISSLRPPDVSTWLIIQRYLAKDDPNDWRLFWPHVNPEALHWQKAEEDIMRIGAHFKIPDLSFWKDLGWLGEFYKTEVGVEVLVSFDLVDIVMSLVKRAELHKYLYHQQEALWNKIFSAYFGEEEMRSMVIDHFQEHQIKISKLGYKLREIVK